MTTTTAALLLLGTLLPTLIHFFGWDETRAGKIVTSVSLDLVGAVKAVKKPKDPE